MPPCTYPTGQDPHRHKPLKAPPPAICQTILDQIGNTPLVQLNKVTDGAKCRVLAKCDFFNAGGSVKDRIGLRMVEEAEKDGRLKPGFTIIEPTSGNTGIGLALCAAVKGYRAIITMPEKMSQEKVDVLKALGAEIVRTPTEAAFDSPQSHISVAKRLNAEIPNSIILDQYANPYNPLAHYDATAEEILQQLKETKVDMFIAGAGTGGTITGISRKLKERFPDCIVVGIDPHGSILAQPDLLNSETVSYKVEGIGYDFIPRVLDRKYVDQWYKSSDKESFTMSRRLIREEGILCGGSSGSAVHGAMEAIRAMGYDKDPSKTAVVLLADSVRNYMTKFLNNEWMMNNGFMERPVQISRQRSITAISPIEDVTSPMFDFGGTSISDLQLPQAVCVYDADTCQKAASTMQSHNFDQVPVINQQEKLVGLVTLGNILSRVSHGRCTLSDKVEKAMFPFDKSHDFQNITPKTRLLDLSKFFDKHSSAVVLNEEGKVVHVVTKFDLVSFMIKNNQ